MYSACSLLFASDNVIVTSLSNVIVTFADLHFFAVSPLAFVLSDASTLTEDSCVILFVYSPSLKIPLYRLCNQSAIVFPLLSAKLLLRSCAIDFPFDDTDFPLFLS